MDNLPQTVEVKLEFSKYGCALFPQSKNAKLIAKVHADESPETLKEIVLRGNREGLTALAAAILATAESPVSGFHMHIDEDVNSPVFRSPDGFTLTIDRISQG